MLFKPTAAILLMVSAFANTGFSQLQTGNSPADSLAKPVEKFNNSAQFGKEGMGMGSRITGTSILNISTRPLIVVDGIPYQNISTKDFDFTTADERDYAQLIGLAQEDIKDIVIEHNAVVTAQYGSRAAGGVILVSTKRGDTGKINVNYSYKNTLGVQPRGYDVLNGNDYTMMMKQALYNVRENAMDADLNELNYNASWESYNNYNKNTDWYKEITQRSITHDHSLSVSGNVENLGFRVSGSYLNKEGIIKNSGLKRNTLSVDLNYSFKKYVKLFFTLDYLYTNNGGYFQRKGNLPINELALKKMPNASVNQFDGQGNYTGEFFTPTNDLQGTGYINPVFLVDQSKTESKNNRTIPTFRLEFNPIKQLSYFFTASYTIDNYNADGFYPPIADGWLTWLVPYAETYENKNRNFYTQNELEFKVLQSENHNLTTKAAIHTLSHNPKISYVANRMDNNETYNYSDTKYNSRYETFTLNYTAFNRYTLDFCMNGEKHSLEDEYMINPSVSLHWLASNEEFIKKLNTFNTLSFTASYGTASYGLSTNPYYPFFADPSFATKYAFKNLNVGFNFAILNNRFNFHFNYFNRITEPQNYELVVDSVSQGYPPTTYLSSSYVPGLESKNQGWEMNLQTSIIKHKDFSFDFSFTLYKMSEKYLNIPENVTYIYGDIGGNGKYIRKLENNIPVGNVYGFLYEGVYADDEEARAIGANSNYINDLDGNPVSVKFDNSYYFQAGDAKYADLNYDGNIDESDLSAIGNVNPVFSGSGGPSFRYKGWWLGVYFNFRYGNDILNIARLSLESMNTYSNQSKAVLGRWRATGDVADIPRAVLNNQYNALGSDRFVEDGSFIRLKAITLKYDFDNSIVQKLYLNNLSCFVTCRNLFTLTKYKGADADIMLNNTWSENGYDYNYNAIKQEFTFGLNIGI